MYWCQYSHALHHALMQVLIHIQGTDGTPGEKGDPGLVGRMGPPGKLVSHIIGVLQQLVWLLPQYFTYRLKFTRVG